MLRPYLNFLLINIEYKSMKKIDQYQVKRSKSLKDEKIRKLQKQFSPKSFYEKYATSSSISNSLSYLFNCISLVTGVTAFFKLLMLVLGGSKGKVLFTIVMKVART